MVQIKFQYLINLFQDFMQKLFLKIRNILLETVEAVPALF
jgi:hypothetical protein